jgi:alkylation response protein AidB-like acyl-CoA dehydrogenase
MSAAVASAKELQPLIRQSRDLTESQRRLAAPVVDALRARRLFRLALPAEFEGLALPPVDALAVYELLSGAEASVAWIVWNNSLPCYFGRFLSPEARAEIFGNTESLYACSTRPTGRAVADGDSFVVTGRWSLVSGCEFADWLALRCTVYERGEPRMLQPKVPEVRLVWLRRADIEIIDTWYTGGLRGTGSHDVEVKEKRVPQRHAPSPQDASTMPGALGRVPIVCNLSAGYGAQLLGIGEAAIEALITLTANKPAFDPGPALGDRPAVLAAIAQHRTRLAAARHHLRDCVSRLWASVQTGAASVEGIGEVFGAAHLAMAQGREAVFAMYALAGASALYTSSPLERMHRDVHAMAAHVIAQPFWLEDTGRVMLGIKPGYPLYLV